MLEALEESKRILDRFQITKEFDISKKRVDDELNSLNDKININSELISFFCNNIDKDLKEVYDKFAKILYIIVNSHSTLKVNNDLGDINDLKFMLDCIKEANEAIDTMIFMVRG